MKDRTKAFIQGFKEFITRGNILDLAIAFVIGAAFRAIVNSLVDDIIMPLVSLLVKENSFSELKWVISGTEIRYGMFIHASIEFFIIALSIYVAITLVIRRKQFNEQVEAVKTPEEPKEEIIPADIQLLTEIRDQLKELNPNKEEL
ncbi:MAG: large conductance mechanosensitive channel protein MscL [Acholeplasmataceae bacterium]